MTHDLRSSAKRFGGRGSRRGAYILIVVLGLTAVVTTLGWAFLDAQSTVVPEAVNWVGSIRSQYLAESGIALGTHYLMYPPTTVSCGGYWAGGSNIAVDATSDYVNVTLSHSNTDRYLFTIAATGVAKNPDGTVRGKHTITAEVLKPTDGKWHLCQAYLGAQDDTDMPSSVRINGDLHVNGYLYSQAWCPGKVSTSGALDWHGTGPPASTTAFAPALVLPTATVSKYTSYTINGTSYNDNHFTGSEMSQVQANALNAQDWSATNPGRIIYHNGDLNLNSGVSINGTLVVSGSLRIDANNVVVTAQPDFPALVVGGFIYFEWINYKATILGSVICGAGVWDNNFAGTRLDITGTLITAPGIYAILADDNYNITWDANRSTFWDFENGTGTREPVTVLSWRDN